MSVALAESFAPIVRHDHDGRQSQPIIDARNVAVAFKVEHGVVDAVKDSRFSSIAARRSPSLANPVRASR